ncbi:phospholipase A2-like [Periplaneta americana]|uniref:phospholipase A2-like n=1 Tax=Periplaneta americana TaxID=6978 RepID=UPI0037E87A41
MNTSAKSHSMKILISLYIGLATDLVISDSTDTEDTELQPRSGFISNIVGGIVKPLNTFLPAQKDLIGGIVRPVNVIADGIESQLKPIFPGTHWCGGGNRARDIEDLGLFRITDDCCREHDNCPDNIPAGESRHGLNNTGLFTRSHCDCDDRFYECLKDARTLISKKIGVTYFNILRPNCFKMDFLVKGCEEYDGLLIKRCARYGYDFSSQMSWQWFEAREF